MASFADLAASRREWIENVLKPWCAQASRRDLLNAEAEWGDIAGRVDPAGTLWTWAWGRFPNLVHEGLPGVNETYPVRVTLRDGSSLTGYPDSRRSEQGRLVLVATDAGRDLSELGPFSIDEIASVARA